jgi:hypothetical protein
MLVKREEPDDRLVKQFVFYKGVKFELIPVLLIPPVHGRWRKVFTIWITHTVCYVIIG